MAYDDSKCLSCKKNPPIVQGGWCLKCINDARGQPEAPLVENKEHWTESGETESPTSTTSTPSPTLASQIRNCKCLGNKRNITSYILVGLATVLFVSYFRPDIMTFQVQVHWLLFIVEMFFIPGIPMLIIPGFGIWMFIDYCKTHETDRDSVEITFACIFIACGIVSIFIMPDFVYGEFLNTMVTDLDDAQRIGIIQNYNCYQLKAARIHTVLNHDVWPHYPDRHESDDRISVDAWMETQIRVDVRQQLIDCGLPRSGY